MTRAATFWTWLTADGACRVCDGHGRRLVIDGRRQRNGGDAARVRRSLIDHARVWHGPEVAPAIEAGDAFPGRSVAPGVA